VAVTREAAPGAGAGTGARADDLHRAWAPRPGLPGFLSAVNHKQVGRRFVVTAFVFLLIGGIEALLIRIQLGGPESTFLSPDAYNAVFTMHGTTMMFLFAVPMLEGLAMYLVPLMIGTRDMPFPRLNAFGYWCYLFGGVLLHWSFLTGSAPDGGWFAYTPLTGPEFSPGRNLDYWLLGVTFVEVSGIVGALELVVLILKQRAPGMSLGRMPLFVWSVLVMAVMMLFAFPAVIAATVLLEVERKFGAPFYDPGGGGNPLLWQHLFWVFGHPEVYIMLVPATGIVSSVVAAACRRVVAAYLLVAASLVTIGVISFGLWVHHMFTVGLPALVLAFFAVASASIAIPSGVQVFAWIATIWRAPRRPRWDTPLLFVAGFIAIFVLGGMTGVMVASAPFDFQVHDSFFVVAHFHYVLIGGVVFPVLAGLHHWFPKLTGRRPSERLGKASFWLTFVGFNVAFLPQHVLGLLGMPRRVYTYGPDLGWNAYNLVSTLGSFVLAAGVVVFTANLARAWRRGPEAGDDPWGADSLEWATASPPPPYNFRSIPSVGSRAPLWDRGDAADAVLDDRARQAVAALDTPTAGRREQVRTSMLDARPEAVFTVPGSSYWPLVTAAALAVGLVGVLVEVLGLVALGVVAAAVGLVRWLHPGVSAAEALARGTSDPEEVVEAPSGRPEGRPEAWHGTLFGLLSLGAVLAAFLYSYFYLGVTAGEWPPAGTPLPPLGSAAAATATLGLVALPLWWMRGGREGHASRRRARGGLAVVLVVGGAFAAQVGAVVAGLPFTLTTDAYAAIFVTVHAFVLTVAGGGLLMAAVVLRQVWRAGDHDHPHSAVQVASLWWWFVVAAWLAVWVALYLTPHLR
jgi:cytochrome c oxidase subunit I